MIEIKIVTIVLFISEYLAAFRLKNNKFFYVFYVLAAADPITYILSHLLHSNSIWWHIFQLSAIALVISIPGLKLKYKIGIAFVVSCYPLLDTSKNALNIELVIISVLIIAIITENLIKEILGSKTLKLYYILLIIYFVTLGISSYMYYKNYNVFFISHLPRMIAYSIISLLIVIVGPDYNIYFELKFLNKYFQKHFQGIETASDNSIIFGTLSEIEKQVLLLVAKGYTSKEIAEKVGRSKKSIDRYRSNIRKKLGITKTAQLKKAVGGFKIMHNTI